MDAVMQGILIGVGTAVSLDILMHIWKIIKKRTEKIKKFYTDEQRRELKGIIKDVIVENKLVNKDELQPLITAAIAKNNVATKEELKPLSQNQTDLKNELKDIKNKVENIQDDMHTLEEANLADLKNNLLHSFDFCNNRGYATPEDVDTWFKMYDSYIKLHGNSFMEAMAEDFRAIPVRTRVKKYIDDDNNHHNN